MNADLYYMTLGQLFAEWSKTAGQQRFGQYVINSNRVADVVQLPCPDIFYETNEHVALQKLFALGETIGH